MDAGDWIAIYAGVVATGTFFLEMRRWFESGPKIFVKANPGMSVVGAGGVEAEDLLMATVTNRGDAPTTITHFGVVEYANAWRRWRHKASRSFIIPHPQFAQPLPHVLNVGEQWSGAAHDRTDVIGDLLTGKMWVAIHTTDRSRPYVAPIRKWTEEVKLDKAQVV